MSRSLRALLVFLAAPKEKMFEFYGTVLGFRQLMHPRDEARLV